jgi:hypothetical protein
MQENTEITKEKVDEIILELLKNHLNLKFK